jgi:predicted DNA-binding transcriptional regulator AlpA
VQDEIQKSRRYVDARTLRGRYGNRSDQWIRDKLEKDPRFPKPEPIPGRLRLWREDKLDAYDDGVA